MSTLENEEPTVQRATSIQSGTGPATSSATPQPAAGNNEQNKNQTATEAEQHVNIANEDASKEAIKEEVASSTMVDKPVADTNLVTPAPAVSATPSPAIHTTTNEQHQPANTIQQVAKANTEVQPAALPPMTIDDLLTLKIASDPQISPDGRFIIYSILSCATDSNTTASTIWLVDANDNKAEPHQLSTGTHHDTQPRWSPDGQTIAFLSDRTGTTQLYTLSRQGGEARCITTLPQGVTEYSWHPAGQTFLVHSAWKPQDEKQQSINTVQTAATTTTGNVHNANIYKVYTHLNARWDGEGERYDRHQQLWLVPLTGKPQRLTSEPVDLVQSCWSPDGQEIVCCANRRTDPDLSVSMALWVLTLATGKLRRLTPEDGLAQMPSWSPDGQQIAYLYTSDQTEASNITPWIVNVHGESNPHLAVPGADAYTSQAWIIDELRSEYLSRPLWYPDSRALLLPFQEHGQLHLYRLDLAQQKMQRLTQGNGRYISPQLSKNGQRITMVRADWFTPGDIWYMDNNSQRPLKLTKINDPILQSHHLTRPQRIHWQSFDGQQIEGFLYLPELTSSQKIPLILAPHGGPSLAWGDSYVHEFQVLAGRGIAVLAPNPRGSAGYGEEFSRSVLNDWGGADFKDLMAGLDYVIANEPIDPQRLGISGMSYGGYMTNWAISQDQRFKAAVSRNGISSLPSATLLSDQTIWFTLSMNETSQPEQRSALTFVDKIHTPLLLLHGENDLRCPTSESYQLFIALRKRKQPAELVTYPGASHLMDWPDVGTPYQRIDRLHRTIQWFERFLISAQQN
jgi:Dipeptidyl aminopeptidases/acylaminoacyl-peptidases